MEFKEAKIIFNQLYQNIDGLQISLSARKKLNLEDKTLVYGEVLFDEFIKVLQKIKPKKNNIFYDLGCGIGKPTIITALLFNLKKSVGIDILADLVFEAKSIAQKLKQIRPDLKTEIEFRQDDIFTTDFSEADIIFSHATCFTEEQMEALEKKFLKLKKGTKIIIVTKSLKKDEVFYLLEKENYATSWGKATFWLYEKIV